LVFIQGKYNELDQRFNRMALKGDALSFNFNSNNIFSDVIYATRQ
jgi:hypothetical protein